MAKIILNVELKDKTASGLKDIENNISQIGKTFSKTTPKLNTAQLEKSVNNLRKGYANLLNTIQGTEKYYKKGTFSNIAKDAEKYLNELKGLDKTSDEYQKNVQNLQVKLGELQANFAETRKSATNFHGSLQEIVGGFLKFQVAAMIVMKPLEMVRQAWASINETLVKTEDAVISLQRVINNPSLSNSDISGKLYDLAQRYGQTFDNVNDIAQNFARTGMSWVETIQATESALLALNVAELDATQASDGMIAIMQQFGYEATELTGIIDMLNKVADNYAVTTDKLLTALQRTGSSAKNAKLDLAETVGIITALSEATERSGENIGTAVNSLIQYSSKDTALDTFASLDKNTANVVAKYRKGGATILDVWMAVSSVINNMDSRQESILAGLANSEDMTDLNQELQDELGDIFETISDVYGTANTFRKNYFVALLGNMETVKDAIETANDANGYSQKENEKYLESYTAKVNQLNAKWQELANNEQGFLAFKKGLVDIGISGLEILDWMGGLRTATLALGGILLSLLPSINLKLKEIGITINSYGKWITIAITALSVIVGIFEQYNQKQKETRAQAIANYEANKKEAESLVDLYTRFLELEKITEKTNEQQNEFNTITESIVKSLGYEAYELDNLTKGTDAYIKKVKELTQAKLEDYKLQAQANANNQRNVYGEYSAGEINLSSVSRDNPEVLTALLNSEYADSIYQNKLLAILGLGGLAFKDTGSAIDTVDQLEDLQKWLYDNGYGESDLYTEISNRLKEAKEVSETYLIAQIESLFYKNAAENGIDWTQENANKIIEGLLQDELYEKGINSEYLKKFIRNYAKDVFGIVEEKNNQNTEKTDEWNDTLETTISNYKDLLDVLNSIMNEEKEIVNLEEKKQAIQERQLELEKAKKALEDARNNKTVYQYNAKTGTWERVADEKAIADAEEGVKNAEKAVEKAEQDYQDALWNSIESDIKTGTLTTREILEKIQDFPQLTTAMIQWLKDEGYAVPDNLVFGPSGTIPPTNSGMSTNNNNSTTNNTNYTVNGIPITQEQAEQYTVAEIIEQVANMPN